MVLVASRIQHPRIVTPGSLRLCEGLSLLGREVRGRLFLQLCPVHASLPIEAVCAGDTGTVTWDLLGDTGPSLCTVGQETRWPRPRQRGHDGAVLDRGEPACGAKLLGNPSVSAVP